MRYTLSDLTASHDARAAISSIHAVRYVSSFPSHDTRDGVPSESGGRLGLRRRSTRGSLCGTDHR